MIGARAASPRDARSVFGKRRSSRDGLQHHCEQCANGTLRIMEQLQDYKNLRSCSYSEDKELRVLSSVLTDSTLEVLPILTGDRLPTWVKLCRSTTTPSSEDSHMDRMFSLAAQASRDLQQERAV